MEQDNVLGAARMWVIGWDNAKDPGPSALRWREQHRDHRGQGRGELAPGIWLQSPATPATAYLGYPTLAGHALILTFPSCSQLQS